MIPNEKNGWKPHKPQIASLPWFTMIAIVFLATLVLNAVVGQITPLARAQVVELKDCRTNKECCNLYLEAGGNYVQEDEIRAKCNLPTLTH